MKLERQKRSLNLGFALISQKVYAKFLSKKTSFELWGTTYFILIKNIVFTQNCKGKTYMFIVRERERIALDLIKWYLSLIFTSKLPICGIKFLIYVHVYTCNT